MRKYISKIAIIFMMAFVIGIGYGVSVKAADDYEVGTTNLNGTTENSAKVGDRLLAPEKGWKRYDDTNSLIISSNPSYETIYKTAGCYNNTERCFETNKPQDVFYAFNFYGSKLRIIDSKHRWTGVRKIILDGTEYTFNSYSDTTIRQVLLFQISNLTMGKHSVKIMKKDSNIANFMDALDIDDTGKLVPYDYTTLTANTNKQNITLNWDKVDGAEKYIIKKSTVQGKEEKIQEIKENSYEDKDVKSGETYYYIVIPVINGKEGTPSNEASVIIEKNTEPSKPDIKPDTKGDAVLTITMTNGNIKSYNVSMEKVNDFIKWYEGRANGSNGTPFYKFDKSINEDKIITEYIVFDKISSFQVEQNK